MPGGVRQQLGEMVPLYNAQKAGDAGRSFGIHAIHASRETCSTDQAPPCETQPGGESGLNRTSYSWEMAETPQVTHLAATAPHPGRCRMMCDAIRWRTSPATTAATPAPLRSPRLLRTVCEGSIRHQHTCGRSLRVLLLAEHWQHRPCRRRPAACASGQALSSGTTGDVLCFALLDAAGRKTPALTAGPESGCRAACA